VDIRGETSKKKEYNKGEKSIRKISTEKKKGRGRGREGGIQREEGGKRERPGGGDGFLMPTKGPFR